MLTIATVALTVLVTFRQLPTTPQMFDIPAEEVNDSMYAFMLATRGHNWLWTVEHEYIPTRAVHGVFAPCDALRQMLEGTSVELFNPDTKVTICPRPLLPPKARTRRIDTAPTIDPAARRRCECIEISGIPIPWCEDDRKQLMNAHECAAHVPDLQPRRHRNSFHETGSPTSRNSHPDPI